MHLSDTLQVSVKVSNTGPRSGEETAQLYLRDMNGSISRPLKELRGFKKVFLNPGQSEVVTFQLTLDDLKFYVEESPGNFSRIFEKGEYSVFVSGSSKPIVDEAATIKAQEKATAEERAKEKGREPSDWAKKIIKRIRVYKAATFVLE